MVSGADIPDNFALQNLETQGMEATDLYSGSDLPPGLYQWSVEVVELIRNRVTSNTGVAYMTVFKNLPPIISYSASVSLAVCGNKKLNVECKTIIK
jgi:hypothetical protein